jgi:serine/threonine protein kinase/Tfp pilus assembly protein PilF
MKCPKCQAENSETQKFCGECGVSLTSSGDPSVTKTLETPSKGLDLGSTFAGRYQIVEELGKGGMGAVYKALDTQINEEVAIKLIRPEIAADDKTLERFGNELKLARKIGHKNVCKMFHLDKEGDTPYISMEYLEGEDLKSLIRKEEIVPADQAIRIAQQVCEGLVEAHRLGVVHRDLKPQNIMMAKDGQAKIMDFGIARSVEAPGVTQTGVIIGTPDYISPEQAEGREADERSDIYSLGVILYEMVTGQVPFKGDTAISVALKHKAQLPTDPKKWNPEISDDLSRLILICMEKDRERRYQTAAALLADLTNMQEGFPLGTKIRPRRDTFVSSIIRNKLIVFVSLTVLVLLLAFLWFGVFKQKGPPLEIPADKPRIAILYFKNNTGDKELDYMRETLSDQLITDLEQSKFLHVIPISERYDVLTDLNLQETRSYSSAILNAIAKRKPINHVIQGYYALSGGELRINISIQKAGKWEPIASETVSGEMENYFPLIDELTQKIKPYFGLTQAQITEDIDEDVGKISTNSKEAFRLYSEAQKHIGGDNRKCIELLEQAVEIDPDFAMAYRMMAAAFGNLGYGKEGIENIEKAYALVDRVSDRERYIILAEKAQIDGDHGKREELYKRLLTIYPDDALGNTKLGRLYMNRFEDMNRAVDRFMVPILNRVKNGIVYSSCARAYRSLGMYDKAKEILEIYKNEISDGAWIHVQLATTYISQGKYEFAREEISEALALLSREDGYIEMKGHIYFLEGDFLKAEAEYVKRLQSDEISAQARARENLVDLLMAQGRFREAIEQSDMILELAKTHGQKFWETGPVFWKIFSELELGNLKEASQILADAWKQDIEEKEDPYLQAWYSYYRVMILLKMDMLKEAKAAAQAHKDLKEQNINKKEMRYNHFLQGMIAIKENNFDTAIEYLEMAVSLLSSQSKFIQEFHGEFLWGLALAHYESGDLDSAQREFERIIGLTTGRLWWGRLYAKSFYMLGKIFEQKDWKGKAIENYEKFLELWKDADPGLVEVEDAKNRLAKLKTS